MDLSVFQTNFLKIRETPQYITPGLLNLTFTKEKFPYILKIIKHFHFHKREL